MENENTKISFWKKLIFSIKNFEKYEIFLKEKKSKSTSYLLKLIAILSLVTAICMGYIFSQDMKSIKNYFDENITQLSFNRSTNSLSINNNEKFDIYSERILNGKIIINTGDVDDASLEEYKNDLKQHENGIIILKDRFILMSSALNSETTYDYSSFATAYSLEDFDKQYIEDFLNSSTIIRMYIYVAFVIFVIVFISYFISTFITVVLLMLLGYITSKMFKINIDSSGIYNLSIYSLTLPIVLNIIYVILNIIFNIEITYFRTMYTSIAYIYLIASILIIKSDNTKKQQVISKIVESIKEKVDEEVKQDEKENDRKEQNDNSDKKDKKEDVGESTDENLEGDI